MANNITVQFTIPFSDDEYSGPSVTFYKWIPEGHEFNLVRKVDNLTITLSFDKTCVSQIGDVSDEGIQRTMNNRIYKVYAKADLGEIESELASFIFDERDSAFGKHYGLLPDDKKYKHLSDEYDRLGVLTLNAVIKTCNRMLSFARNIKGQYLITLLNHERDNLLNLNNSWHATATLDGGDKFRWMPPGAQHLRLNSIIDRESPIKKEEWQDLNDFVCSIARPNLIFELLANAFYLKNQGHRRSSVIEAVTALEVAVANFSISPKTEGLQISDQRFRIDTENIGNQSNHLGFSGTLRYLIPILFTRDELSDEVLKKCYQAIDIRNNVVHKGQRDIEHSLLNEIIGAINSCCKVLDRYTNKAPNQSS